MFEGVICHCDNGDECQERARTLQILQMANMYRLLFRTVYTARRSSVSVCEWTVFPAKCDKASVFRWVESETEGDTWPHTHTHCDELTSADDCNVLLSDFVEREGEADWVQLEKLTCYLFPYKRRAKHVSISSVNLHRWVWTLWMQLLRVAKLKCVQELLSCCCWWHRWWVGF